jgi:hypothetical protein
MEMSFYIITMLVTVTMSITVIDMALYEIFERYNRLWLLPTRAILYNFILSFGAGELISELAKDTNISEYFIKGAFILTVEVLSFFYLKYLESTETGEERIKKDNLDNRLASIKIEDLRLSDLDPKLIKAILKYLVFVISIFVLGLALIIGLHRF